MKQLLLSLFSILLVTMTFAGPQKQYIQAGNLKHVPGDTLELYNTDGNKINNMTISVSGSDPSVDALVGYIWLKSTITTDLTNVYVRRVVNQEVDGSTNSFCFGINCYPPWVNESAVADTVKVGQTNKSFYADYYPEGNGGLTSITYEFFDNITLGVPVSAKATIEFGISGTPVYTDKLVFKGPYPNPASQSASFEYNFPSSSNNAVLIIRNMLGVEMENITFENQNGKKTIDVSSYASGIYFYSLVVDGKVLQSKKMVVKH